ncbi:MAG: GPP34 family phosphoprotein [Micromonosporaceae bacterium]|nr:GPP34 family phosphoprotein [Micromonosporaceae bacterium]
MLAPSPVHQRLFLLAHDEYHGFRPRIHPPTLNAGLAGALLIDLVLAERIHIEHGHMIITDLYDHSLVGEPIADQTLTTIRARIQASAADPLRDQIRALGQGLYERVQGGLVAASVLTTTRRWGITRHRPVEQRTLIQAQSILSAGLRNTQPANLAVDALAGLVGVLGLHDAVYLGAPGEVQPLIDQAMVRVRHQATGCCQAVPAIITAVDAAAGDLTTAVYR